VHCYDDCTVNIVVAIIIIIIIGVLLMQSLENEVDRWIPSFDELTEQRRKLAEENPGDGELLRQRDDQLRQLHERWDRLVRRMEQKSNDVIVYTLHFPKLS